MAATFTMAASMSFRTYFLFCSVVIFATILLRLGGVINHIQFWKRGFTITSLDAQMIGSAPELVRSFMRYYNLSC